MFKDTVFTYKPIVFKIIQTYCFWTLYVVCMYYVCMSHSTFGYCWLAAASLVIKVPAWAVYVNWSGVGDGTFPLVTLGNFTLQESCLLYCLVEPPGNFAIGCVIHVTFILKNISQYKNIRCVIKPRLSYAK